MDINNNPAGTLCSITSFKCKYNAYKAHRIDLGKNQWPTKECNRICQKNCCYLVKKLLEEVCVISSDRATDGGEAPPPHTPAVGSHNTLQSCQNYSSLLTCTDQLHSWTSWDMQILQQRRTKDSLLLPGPGLWVSGLDSLSWGSLSELSLRENRDDQREQIRGWERCSHPTIPLVLIIE